MAQLGGFSFGPKAPYFRPLKFLELLVNEIIKASTKKALVNQEKILKIVLQMRELVFQVVLQVKKIKIGISLIRGSGITNNEIKDIIGTIKSLEIRGILLKRTTKKISS